MKEIVVISKKLTSKFLEVIKSGLGPDVGCEPPFRPR
jgi:hypothetical protein